MKRATDARGDVQLIGPDEIVASMPDQPRPPRNPLAMKVKVSHQGLARDIAIVPDLAFGLRFRNGSRRCFMVEIDRGTMPASRSDFRQTSFERKMRAYLTAHAAKQHERHFGWKPFRVLTVTTDEHRMRSMMEALRRVQVPGSMGAVLYLFATRHDLAATDPLAHPWRDGNGRFVPLI